MPRLRKLRCSSFETSGSGRSFLTDAVDVEPEIFSDGFESGDLACWTAVTGGTKTGTCTSPPPPPAGETVASVYSSEGLLYSLAGGTSAEHVLYFAGRPVAVLEVAGTTGTLTYLTTDHLGTPVLATNGVGAEVWSGGFEPFGEDWNGAEAAGVFLRLPGQWESGVWEEAEMGADVYYNVHRWYGRGVGRYTKADPLGLNGGKNLLAYAASQPTRLVDPLGLIAWDCKTVEISAGAVGTARTAFVECDTGCVSGKRTVANYALGNLGFGLDVAFPFETSFYMLEDGLSRPDPSALEGQFAARGCSLTIFIGFSVTEVRQGKGFGSFSFSPSFGLGGGCFVVTGASKLLNVQESCCYSGPSIRAAP
jgi:RHS repeat-associated protein